MTRDYYRVRWQTCFASLDTELLTGVPGKQIDWFELGDGWNHDSHSYPSQPHGDTYGIATRIAQSLNSSH